MNGVLDSVAGWWSVGFVGDGGGGAVTTEGRQDKRPHIVARTVVCFDWSFPAFPHLADHKRDVRVSELPNIFNEDRTSQQESV
ncbi:hypothetical protein QBK93_24220 [Rhizobium leguminosarum]|uniref:hypothetical protein n=1 Tax=Rhizobium leguminosarum TaxID=384 RepID=UPI0024A98D19|nr:hypothetical protein [Rhizobium leguminosarum]MDI5927774.1 hypothetical protein [Rhizobium leguminosarum]